MPVNLRMDLRQKILFLLSLPGASLALAQSSGEPENIRFTWSEAPVFMSASLPFSRYRRAGEKAYPAEAGFEAGIFVDYALKQKYRFRVGMELQSRAFSLNSVSEGKNLSGKSYIKTIEGRTRMFFVQFPFLLELNRESENRKLRWMAGAGGGLRIWTRQAFTYQYEIPADSLLIRGADNSGNDAMDQMELNALLCLVYKPHKRWEFALQAGYKLLGISIGKAAFISRSEQNSSLSLKAFFSPGRISGLRFF